LLRDPEFVLEGVPQLVQTVRQGPETKACLGGPLLDHFDQNIHVADGELYGATYADGSNAAMIGTAESRWRICSSSA